VRKGYMKHPSAFETIEFEKTSGELNMHGFTYFSMA